MTSISLPPQSHSTLVHSSQTQPFDGHTRRNLSMSTPLPNPPFVFPARDQVSNGNDNLPSPGFSVAPSARVPRAIPPPLPVFSFNPGSDQAPPQPSPPLAPPVNRPSGHRRRPSEFVGGDKLVSPGITSPPQPAPTTVDQNNDGNSMEPPAKLPSPGPGFSAGGPGKRHHAHRRSAAVSSVDLTAISNALDTKPTLGSAPCVPADRKSDVPSYDEVPRPLSHSATAFFQRSPPVSPQFPTPGASSSQDKLTASDGPGPAEEEQSIPSEDPMETSENAPTAQPAQEVGSSSPPAIEISPSSEDKPRVRPKTADASWLFDKAGSSASGNGSHHKRSLSASGHSRAYKSLSTSGLLDAALRKNDHSGDDSSRYSYSEDESDTSGDPNESGISKKRSKSKARKKVRSWAGSILTRGKGKRDQSRRDASSETSKSNTPPMITRTNSDLGSGLDVDFDDDNMVVLRTSTNPQIPADVVDTTVQPAAEAEPTLENSWKPRSFYEQGLPDQVSSAVIDLDAALGPFNTPDMRPNEPAATTSGFSVATRRMYSGGRRGEFVGPEMRYHRRTESAPEMPPFDRSLLNSNRLTTSSSFENPDVFDEEEEDAFLAATSEPSQEDERRVSQVGSVLVDQTDEHTSSQDSSETVRGRPADEGTTMDSEYAAGLGIQRHASTDFSVIGAPTSEPEREFSEHHDFAEQMRNARNPFMNPPRSPVEILRQEDWQQQHRAPVPPSPDVSPRFMAADKRPATSPIELGGNIPAFSLQGGAPSSQSNSAFSSPDFTGSTSDTRRSVATPSTIDRNFFHPSYNNMSADFPHASVEDVPSLTSSASTTTNPLQRFSASFFTRRGSSDRAASFSVGVNRRTSASHAAKRSSLASLSKLVVGNHANERSKLSYEEKPPGDMPEKGKRKGRGIGRLMHFWRTKDKDKNEETAPADEERPT